MALYFETAVKFDTICEDGRERKVSHRYLLGGTQN